MRLALAVLALLAVTAPPAAAQSLSLGVGRDDVKVGERTRVAGALRGVTQRARRTVVVEIAEHPYSRWVVAERTRTDRRGRFVVVAAPRRNTKIRARVGSTRSPERTIYADFAGRITRIGPGGQQPRIRATVFAPRGTAVRRAPVFAYLRRDGESWRLVAQGSWSTVARRYVATTLPFPAGSLVRADQVYVCAKEPDPDAFGRPSERDRRCGEPELASEPTTAPGTGTGTETGSAPPPSTGTTPPADPNPSPGAGPSWSFGLNGDGWVSQFRPWSEGPPDRFFFESFPGEVRFSINSPQSETQWSGSGSFSAPSGQTLAVGTYTGAERSSREGVPSMDITGNGRGCSTSGGHSRFTVHELQRDGGGKVNRIRVSFEFRCGGPDDPADTGSFTYSAG